MSLAPTVLRTAGFVVLALLCAVAALHFSQRAVDAWNVDQSGRVALNVFAALAAVLLAGGSLRQARRASGVQAGP